MKAEQDRTVAEKLNSAELIEADLKAQADAVKREVQTKLQAELNNITAQGKEFQVQKETELAAQVAADKATSAELVGQSEAAGSESQAKERKFEEDKAQLDVFAKLENKKLRIASSAEVGARGLTFNDDRASQFVHSAMRAFHAKFASTELAPMQEPLMKK